jgi:polyhydroxybutyrate depolymerase
MAARISCAVAVLATLAGAATACGGGGGDGGTGDTARPAGDPPATATTSATAPCPNAGPVDGGTLRMPASPRPGATPLLVVVIPGGDGDPTDRLGIGAAATRAGFGVLYPTSDDQFWTLNRRQGTADVTAVAGLLDRTLATGCFDRRRVSITGVSNGAGFAARLACELPGRFAAVVPVAAGYRALDPCPAAARASFFAIHGTADTVVPYNGKPPDRAGSVPRYTSAWARRDGCTATPRTTRPRALVTRVRYGGCDGGLSVELLRLSRTDHGWPGAGPPLPRHNPSGVKATGEVLRFVRAARRP